MLMEDIGPPPLADVSSADQALALVEIAPRVFPLAFVFECSLQQSCFRTTRKTSAEWYLRILDVSCLACRAVMRGGMRTEVSSVGGRARTWR